MQYKSLQISCRFVLCGCDIRGKDMAWQYLRTGRWEKYLDLKERIIHKYEYKLLPWLLKLYTAANIQHSMVRDLRYIQLFFLRCKSSGVLRRAFL